MPVAAQKGPRSSINSPKGVEWIPVILLNTTAQVWTHNYNTCPAAILLFNNSATSSGGVQVTINTTVNVTPTSNANAITLTPSASANCNVLVIWPRTMEDLPNINGIPPTNFV